jgi:hypothetical protein
LLLQEQAIYKTISFQLFSSRHLQYIP